MIAYSKSDSANSPRSTRLIKTVIVGIRLICFAATMGSLYIVFSLNRLTISIIPLLAIFIIWIVGNLFHKEGIFTLVFVFTILWIALGFAFNFPLRWLLIATFSSLITWDLDYFSFQSNMAMRIIELSHLFIKHLQRLFVTIGIGILLTILPFITSVKLSLWLAFPLGLGIILGFREIFRYSKELLSKN